MIDATRDRGTPRTRRGRATRAALIAAARERFLVDGYLNVGVPSIAETAKRSSASFYTYFDSKADLLQVLATEAIEAFDGQLRDDLAAPGADVAELRERIVRTVWTAYRDELPIFISIFQTAMRDRDVDLEPWSGLRAALVSTITETNRRAVEAGADLPGPATIAAESIASMFEMFCFIWLGQGGDAPGVEVDEATAVATLAGLWAASMQPSVDVTRER